MRAVRDPSVRPSYGDFLNSFAMKARARCELKQLCCNCYINPDFLVKMSDISEHSEFCDSEKKKKGKAQWSYDKMLID